MNTNIRSTLSTSISLGLVSFAITSALVASVAAPATVISFGLLAVYGLIEIAIVSYQAPRHPCSQHAATPSTHRSAHSGAIIRYPMGTCQGLARAA